MYLELVPLPADAARQARLFDQLFHLLQERRLGHDLALFICLSGGPDGMSEGPPPHPATLAWGYSRERADPPHTPKGLLHRKGASLVGF